MNRLQAAKMLRQSREGLPVLFTGLDATFEVRPLYLPPEIEWDTLREKPIRSLPGRLFCFFRPVGNVKPNGLVRNLTWKQTLGFIRRNFKRS